MSSRFSRTYGRRREGGESMSSWRSREEELPEDICADLEGSCGCGEHDHSGESGCSGRWSGWSGGCSCESGHGHRYGREHSCGDRSGHDRHCRHDGSSCGCGCGGHGHCRRHRRRRAIPVGNITVDCRPVTFRTPGQAINVVSCPVSQTVVVPVSQRVNFLVPLPNGQTCCIPQTQQVQMPVVTTVHTPPVQTPTGFFPPGGFPSCGCGH